jgi:hypothetical protein
MRAVLDLLTGDTSRFFLLNPIALEWADGKTPLTVKQQDLWLLGTAERLVLFAAGPQPHVLWRGDAQVTVETVKTYLTTTGKLSGGEWLMPEVPAPSAIKLPLPLMSTYQSYLKPLLGMLRPGNGQSPGVAEQPAESRLSLRESPAFRGAKGDNT